MATLARSVLKILLFIVLFSLSMRFIHTYPLPMPMAQQRYLIAISETFGVNDYEGFYLSAVAVVNLIVAAIEYTLIMKLWRHYRAKRKDAVTS